MTTTTEDPQASVADAERDVVQAEADIASGKRSISEAALHKLRDAWRHADLTAQGARQKAEQDRREARLSGLAVIGAKVDELARPEHAEKLADALRAAAAACNQVLALAAAHDADVAALVAAATDFRAEPVAPAGPRGTSAYVAVKGTAITHGRVTVSPIASHVREALGHAMSGDVDRAVAKVQAVATTPEPRRPDHLLRNMLSGNIVPIYGELNDGMKAQLKTTNPRSGQLVELSDHDVNLYMEGRLA